MITPYFYRINNSINGLFLSNPLNYRKSKWKDQKDAI